MTRARPAPATSLLPYEAAVADIRAGRISPVYLLTGPSHVAAGAVRQALLEAIVPSGHEALDAPAFDGASTPWADVVAVLRTPSWSGGRVVTVDEPAGLGESGDASAATAGEPASLAPLEAYIERPEPAAVLVLRCRGRVDRRRRAVKAIQERGGLVECACEDREALASWVTRRVRDAGGRIAPHLARQLVEQVGADLDRVASEADKLVAYAGAGPVDEAALRAVVTPSDEVNAFRLVDALGRRDPEAVAAEIERLRAAGEPPLRLLALLAGQFRLMRHAADLAKRGLRAEDVARELGQHPFRVRRAMEQSRRFSGEELDRCLEALWLAEWRIKSGAWSERGALLWVTAALVTGGWGDAGSQRAGGAYEKQNALQRRRAVHGSRARPTWKPEPGRTPS
ncbi:MAG: DNA polymerase III subunit delta [Clostridia bacterium]|nr:DNA polymerase III subunit delta [Clostridia bacterium]